MLKRIVFHDGFFVFLMLMGVITEAIVIYLTVKMSQKKDDKPKAKKYMNIGIVTAILVALLLGFITYDHLKHRPASS